MPSPRALPVFALVALLTAPATPAAADPASTGPATSGVTLTDTAPTNPASCAPPGKLLCLQITSPRSPGKFLDIDAPGDPHSYLRLTGEGGPSSFWRLDANADSVVRIGNLESGNCVDVWRTNSYLDQWECVGQSSQRWFLSPFAPNSGTYRIRQVDTGRCFTRDSADWIYTAACAAGNDQQEWALGVGGQSPPGVRNLAIKHAMRQCDVEPSSCAWKEKLAAKSPAFLGPGECVSQLVRNLGTNENSYTRTWSHTVGWENTLGGSVTLSVETGISLGVETKISAAIEANYAHSWVGSETTSDAVTIVLKPGEYGWVTRRPLLKKVTGTWTLDVGGLPWTLPAVVKIPAKDGTDNQLSVVVLRSGATAPTGCRG